MAFCRKIVHSWYTMVVGILLSLIVLLRRDLNVSRSLHAARDSYAYHNSTVFDDFVAKRKILPVLSQFGEYLIYPNVRTPRKRQERRNDVTLLTHASYYNLRYLPDLVNAWKGPVSVAVFTSMPTKAMLLIDLLCRCSASVRSLVRWHMVVPFSERFDAHPLPLLSGEADVLSVLQHLKSDEKRANIVCHNLDALLQSLDRKERNYETSDGLAYPNNVVRNAAWQHSRTKYVLNVDIDMMPSRNLYKSLVKFLSTTSPNENAPSGSKVTWVIPVFEMKEDVYLKDKSLFPVGKPDLLEYVEKGVVRQFYFEPCFKCQNCTNHEKWFELQDAGTDIAESTVKFDMKQPCEPFLVIPRSAPKFDERFVQYGYNRISHVCEVFATGFEFRLLDTPFLVHIGSKEDNSAGFHTAKERENKLNEARFHSFRQELRQKYARSKNFC